MYRREVFTVVGFVLFLLGMLSLILSFTGMQFVFMKWLDAWGKGYGTLLRILIIGLGIVMAYLGTSSKAKNSDKN